MKRPGSRRRVHWHIGRIGWKAAAKMIEKDGYRLLKLADGHAELLTTGGEAYYYLTARSLALLENSSSTTNVRSTKE